MRAHGELDQAEALDGGVLAVHVARAYAYSFQKNLEKAREAEARARAIDARDPRVLLLRASLAAKARQTDEAFGLARSLAETTRDRFYLSSAYGVLTDVYRARQDWDAVEAMHRSLAGKARELLKAKGPSDEVEKLVTEAEGASPRSAEAPYARGLLHAALGNPVRARVAFNTALALEPKHAGAMAGLQAAGP